MEGKDRKRSLKIALFSDSAFPILNGVSVSIEMLMTELRESGHSVELYTTNYPGYQEQDANIFRVNGVRTPWSGDYPLAIPPFTKTYLEFRSKKFDIIHTHTPWTLGHIGLRWARLFGYPIVSSYHTFYDKYAHYVPYLSKRSIKRIIGYNTHYYYNEVDSVIVPSRCAKNWLFKHRVNKPIFSIPTAIKKKGSYFRSECRNNMGVHPSQKILLYLGRMAKEKNLDTLLKGVSEAIEYDKKIRLWMVGEGPYEAHLKKRVRELGIGDYVKFIGGVSQNEVGRYYAIADAFIFTSTTETQGLVINEAQSYGLPCIAVNKGGAAESVENGVDGYLISNSSLELAKKINLLLNNCELYANLSRNALKKSQNYVPERMCYSVLKVYSEVLNLPLSSILPEDKYLHKQLSIPYIL